VPAVTLIIRHVPHPLLNPHFAHVAVSRHVSIYSGGGSQVADVVFSPMVLGPSTTVQEVQQMWNNFCFFIGYLSPFTNHAHLVAVLQQQISCIDLWFIIHLFTCATWME